jgi:hypothetical protein
VQAKGERCYHVFYQLCAGADPTMRKAMGLQQAEAYRYLAHGEAIRIKGMDDAKEFRELCTCLTAVGISTADQQQVHPGGWGERTCRCRGLSQRTRLGGDTLHLSQTLVGCSMPPLGDPLHWLGPLILLRNTSPARGMPTQVFSYVAAILWLGNIEFVSSDTTSIAPGAALQYSAVLLGVSEQALSTALTSRSITTGSERIVTPLNQQQARFFVSTDTPIALSGEGCTAIFPIITLSASCG